MNNESPNAWPLLTEELAPETLQHLTGGTGATPWPGHDLVTPEGRTDPYNDDVNIEDDELGGG